MRPALNQSRFLAVPPNRSRRGDVNAFPTVATGFLDDALDAALADDVVADAQGCAAEFERSRDPHALQDAGWG